MNLGTLISLIFFICITYFIVVTLIYLIIAIKPAEICPGTFPHIAHMWMNFIIRRITIVVSFVFTVTVTIVAVLFCVWCVLVCLPWPLNYMSRIPPLDELHDTGVFTFFGRVLGLLIDWCVPLRYKFKELIQSVGLFIKQFMTEYMKNVNPNLLPLVNAYPPYDKQEEYKAGSGEIEDDDSNLSLAKRMKLAQLKALEKQCVDDNVKEGGIWNTAYNNMIKFSCRTNASQIRQKILMEGDDGKVWRMDIPAEFKKNSIQNE